jgi:hypothetical protein
MSAHHSQPDIIRAKIVRQEPTTEEALVTDPKPLNWTPKPGVGMTVARRADGGIHLTFTDLSEQTIKEWRGFALEHLLGADRLTRNLYDRRTVKIFTDLDAAET